MKQLHYFEVFALPNEEMRPHESLAIGFYGLHTLLEPYKGQIGVSFPYYNQESNRTLGHSFRVFGSKTQCEQLVEKLEAVAGDYIHIQPTEPVPSHVKIYHNFERLHHKSKGGIRRQMKFLATKGLTEEELQMAHDKMVAEAERYFHLPAFYLKSHSTQQHFVLTIGKNSTHQLQQNKRTIKYMREAGHGGFNSYGLSKEVAVPHF